MPEEAITKAITKNARIVNTNLGKSHGSAKEILEAQGMNRQLAERCTSISPETKMRCELPGSHSKDHRNGSVGWLTENDPADHGREW